MRAGILRSKAENGRRSQRSEMASLWPLIVSAPSCSSVGEGERSVLGIVSYAGCRFVVVWTETVSAASREKWQSLRSRRTYGATGRTADRHFVEIQVVICPNDAAYFQGIDMKQTIEWRHEIGLC